ncbi:HAD family hydrolase, partial [archaeon]
MLYTSLQGAPESVLEMCTMTQSLDGTTHSITPEMRFNLEEQVSAMARKGLRTLAVAYRRLPASAAATAASQLAVRSPTSSAEAETDAGTPVEHEPAVSALEKDLVLLGMFGLQDPLRDGVEEALKKCMAAGIRVMMVTGDHRDTAAHIAQECGILRPGLEVMEGSAFRHLSNEQRVDVCTRLAVLARSSPTDKYLLVKTLKEMNEVVAVTGDGTNDAPALRAADVGLAMGIAGTEVAKEASDIVILDDRFSSIVASVRWGRSIKENIRKFLTFQLTINMVALTLTFVTACANGGSTDKFPITPVQLLWVNLIMDSFAALALATEPPSEQLMAHAPQGKTERLITRTMMKNMVGHAIFQTILLLVMTMTEAGNQFFDVKEHGSVQHNTIIFTTFVALQVFNLFNCRTVHDEWNVLAGFSRSFVGQAILAIIVTMQFAMVQFGGHLMQTEPLTARQWMQCIAIGFCSVPVGYLLKLLSACEHQCRKMRTSSLLSHVTALLSVVGATKLLSAVGQRRHALLAQHRVPHNARPCGHVHTPSAPAPSPALMSTRAGTASSPPT